MRSTPNHGWRGCEVPCFISQPTTGEEALDIMDALIRSKFCIDDIGSGLNSGACTGAELEGRHGEMPPCRATPAFCILKTL